MSKMFSIWKKKFKNENGETVEKYFACPKTLRTVKTEELSERISGSCSLTQADVLGCLKALSIEIKLSLLEGSNVKLDGIGTFGIGVTSEGVDDPKEINPKKVKATKITYRADRKLTRDVKDMKFTAEPKAPKGLVVKSSKKVISVLLLVFFLSFSQIGFSQSESSNSCKFKKEDLSHTIQTQVGYRWIDGFLGFYDFKTNLIPSYEIGYKNKYFAKLRYITFSEKYSGNIYLADYDYMLPIRDQRFNLFSLVLGYNFLNAQSNHLLKLGLELGYGFDRLKYEDKHIDYYNYFGIGGELSYKYFITGNIGVGGEINYGKVYGNDTYLTNYGINLTLSFKF
ncbi:MAG: hypothetical protein EOM29_08255 [Bacteroidia bacterium]|nr:hypothetical protein [Bacteroidia bacterium]